MLTRIARGVRNRLRTAYRTVRNRSRIDALQHDRSLRVHLGCGDDRLPGFVNIDCRPTGAVDVAMDLSLPRLADGSVSFAFTTRSSSISTVRRAGRTCSGSAARSPRRAPAATPAFHTFRTSRGSTSSAVPAPPGRCSISTTSTATTHGDPEGQAAWWLGQLHKSLFDEDEVAGLLAQSGFASAVMFCYTYPGEPDGVRVTMGFYATAAAVAPAELREQCLAFLQTFADVHIRLATLEWLLPRAE